MAIPIRSLFCRAVCMAGLVCSTAGSANAQGFDNRWLSFELDNTRLVAPAEVGSEDFEDRDYATGDLDMVLGRCTTTDVWINQTR